VSAGAPYSSKFFDTRAEGARRSADVVMPLVLSTFAPTSVVDVGCGTGSWLAAARAWGVSDVVGVDGPYVTDDLLEIPSAAFVAHDLERPLALDRRFDMAFSLEVAEHLSPSVASEHVRSLAQLASIVLFSAAIPGQGGNEHRNEQWPAYWQELFGQEGYVAFDWPRRVIWGDDRVAAWYRQNCVLFTDSVAAVEVEARIAMPPEDLLALVHPAIFLNATERAHRALPPPESVSAAEAARYAVTEAARGGARRLRTVWRAVRR
jgi:SAM-dependent methyltransferase